MKIVVQKVSQASVAVDDKLVGSIDCGFLLLLGLHHDDTHEISEYMIKKILHLRVFADEDGKMNKSLLDISGKLLLVSQFTLYADCRKGNRPSFMQAMSPEKAEQFYHDFVAKLEAACGQKIQTGQFGAKMSVQLTNEGPVTIILEK